jgi:hypothetical protein
MTSDERMRDHLQAALDQVLAALVVSGGLPEEVPDNVLEAGLANDPAVQDARLGLVSILNRLIDTSTSEGRQALLAIEAAGNACAARCAEAGYRLGLRVGRGESRRGPG